MSNAAALRAETGRRRDSCAMLRPVLRAGDHVLYLGDWDFAGGQIENNTQSVLERGVGPLQWERLALTEEQAGRYDLMIIRKIDRRHKDGRELPSVETEALSQTIIVDKNEKRPSATQLPIYSAGRY